MVTTAELLSLSRTYPIISILIAMILFVIGFKVAAKLLKWILWMLAVITITAAVVMLFL